jgi:hypothetical protein
MRRRRNESPSRGKVSGVTTEQLRLEIQVMVKDALKDLAATSSGVKKVAEEAQAAIPKADALKATMTRLQADLKASGIQAEFFGEKTEGLKERQALLRQAMEDLIQRGISPQTGQMQRLKADYDETSAKVKEFANESGSLTEKIQKLAEGAAAMATARKVAAFSEDAIREFSLAEASAQRLEVALELRGMLASLPALNELANALQQVAGADADLVKQLEAELVAQGKNEDQIKKIIVAAAGLSSVTGDDLSTSVQKLTMTLSGAAREIGGQIPEIKDLTEEQFRHGAAIDIVREKYASFIGKTGETGIAMARTKQNADDLREAFGEGLAPQARVVAELMGNLTGWLANASPGFKEFAGIVAGVVLGALAGLAVRTVAAAAATWGLFGAEMAKNAAMAVGNPLLWVGIAAALALVAATGLLIAAKTKEAQVTSNANAVTEAAASGYRDVGAAIKGATTALDDYTKAVDEAKKRDEAAASWKKSWADEFGKNQAVKQGPAAEIEFEREKKLADAAANHVKKANQETIDQVNAYYDAKQQELITSTARAEAARLAQLTATKVDDLEIQKAAELEAWRGTLEGKALIEKDWDAKIALAREDDAARERERLRQDRTITAQEELAEAAKEHLLQVHFQKELTNLAIENARKAAEAKIAADRAAFEEARKLAAEQGKWGTYAASTFQEKAKDTEVGKMLGWGGQPAQDWKMVLIDSAVNLAMENESVKKVLNIFSSALKGLVEWALVPLAKALTWLYDTVIVPVGNGIIGIINAVIDGIDKALGIFGVNIPKIAALLSSTEIAEQQQRIADKTKAVSEAMDSVRAIFATRRQELDDAYQKNVGSLKNLLELGAISEADYAGRMAAVNTAHAAELATLDATEKSQLTVLQDVLTKLNKGIEVSDTELAKAISQALGSAAVPSLVTPPASVSPVGDIGGGMGDEGGGLSSSSGSTPSTILPASVSAAIRSNDFDPPERNRGNRTVVVNTEVNVEGSIVRESEIADSIATTISARIRRGQYEPV